MPVTVAFPPLTRGHLLGAWPGFVGFRSSGRLRPACATKVLAEDADVRPRRSPRPGVALAEVSDGLAGELPAWIPAMSKRRYGTLDGS
jgi:hypothetical protein